MPALAGKCLIDTNVLIYATVRDDARYAAATDVLDQARAGMFEAAVSVQNLAEMYPNLTGPKRKPPDPPELARRKIESIARLGFIQVLWLDEPVLLKSLELCEQYDVHRQDYFDIQLVATMLVHGIRTVVTENSGDFEAVEEIAVINPFDAL